MSLLHSFFFHFHSIDTTASLIVLFILFICKQSIPEYSKIVQLT